MAGVSNGASSTEAAPPQLQDPGSYPLAAQIPLKGFELPDFPPHASHLRELTFTADIKLDEYQNMVQTHSDAIVTQPPLPDLPKSITHLTFELFGLGFPGTPPFLTRLARSLPNVRSVTFFSCLIDGLDEASRKDAEKFFECLPNLQELHVIDSFARPGFFKTVGGILESHAKGGAGGEGLKLVDVSFTFRGHEDSDFLARVQGEDLPNLIVKGLVGASFDFVPERQDELAEAAEGEDGEKKDNQKINEGILPFASDGRAPTAVRKRFESMSHGAQLTSLKILNLGMYSLRPAEVGEVVYACAGGQESAGLVDITVSVLLEEGWAAKLAEGLQYKGVSSVLEGIEVVGVPDKAVEEGDDWKSGLSVAKLADVEKIAAGCPKLGKFGMSILKVKSAPNVVFLKEGDSWVER
ncbi:uncharacterized protein Z520_08597 [Fonsecaea multimorphosa CBS 102226]|uniref:Uncharacterized protein n=1 Tax=Fonsecaea multimorphosa CBS 102226 TaxID=1442371 RepID=A0A0D2JZA9_9EURO|nr:uncharacterized protein Z520_08597 [Fonsecaea multimorphosa CBS 102226]KIX95889.1 hypothetical protein Z520_08597 [Fonsecaea multimorphosa CBS 102226]OAL21620.1 hypothetical protein AYO22_08016 [Fonsecaea multimorphosa]